MDDTTFGKPSEINGAPIEHVHWLLDKQDLAALSKLISIVDRLTTILVDIQQPVTPSLEKSIRDLKA